MNPWGVLVIAIGIVLIVIGVKGTQHDIASTIVGKSSSGSSSSTGSTGTSGTTLA